MAGSTPLTITSEPPTSAKSLRTLDASSTPAASAAACAGPDGHGVPAVQRVDHVAAGDLLANGLLVGREQRAAENGDERDQGQPDHQRRSGRCRPARIAKRVLAGQPSRRRRPGGPRGCPAPPPAAGRAAGPASPCRRTGRRRRSRSTRPAPPAPARSRASRRRGPPSPPRRWRRRPRSCGARAGRTALLRPRGRPRSPGPRVARIAGNQAREQRDPGAEHERDDDRPEREHGLGVGHVHADARRRARRCPWRDRRRARFPTSEAKTPETRPSRTTERSTCRREAPSVPSVASSRVRCATVIERVLKITNAPTKSEIAGEAEQEPAQDVMNSSTPAASSSACSAPVRTCAVGGAICSSLETRRSAETPSFAATKIEPYARLPCRAWAVGTSKTAIAALPSESTSPNVAMPTSRIGRSPGRPRRRATRSPSLEARSLDAVPASRTTSPPLRPAPADELERVEPRLVRVDAEPERRLRRNRLRPPCRRSSRVRVAGEVDDRARGRLDLGQRPDLAPACSPARSPCRSATSRRPSGR